MHQGNLQRIADRFASMRQQKADLEARRGIAEARLQDFDAQVVQVQKMNAAREEQRLTFERDLDKLSNKYQQEIERNRQAYEAGLEQVKAIALQQQQALDKQSDHMMAREQHHADVMKMMTRVSAVTTWKMPSGTCRSRWRPTCGRACC